MTDRAGTTSLAAVAVYLAATVFASYAVLADSTWDREPGVLPALMVLHAGAGFAIGRWWALALPVAWALLSAGAEGYDTPVWAHVAFLIPLTWIPTTAIGVAARRIVERRRRGTGRLWPSAVILVAGIAVVLAPGLLTLGDHDRGMDRPQAAFDLLDEERGRYGDAGIGDRPEDVYAAHGRVTPVPEDEASSPTSLREDAAFTRPTVFSSRWWVCYPDVCFWFNRDPRDRPRGSGRASQARPEVQGLYLVNPGAETLRGIEIGDSLEDVEDAYPELECRSRGDFGFERFCTGELGAGNRVWFGGDPVDVIVVGRTGMSDS